MVRRGSRKASDLIEVRAARGGLKKLPPSIFQFFTSSNESMTVAELALNDRKKQICRSKMHSYKK